MGKLLLRRIRQRKPGTFSSTLDVLLGNLANTGRGRKQAFSIFVDSALVLLSLWGAYSIRLGSLYSDFQATWYVFLFMPAITVAGFAAFGVYSWVVRSANQRLFRQLLKGSIISTLALLALLFLFPVDGVTPRSVIALFALALWMSTFTARFAWQGIVHNKLKGEPIAIYGAGMAGQQLVRMLAAGDEYQPVLFVDDDERLMGKTIAGLPVVSPQHNELKSKLARNDVNSLVIAIPSLSPLRYQQKITQLEPLDLPILTMPRIAEIVSGAASLDQIRDVSIEDILGRDEVPPDENLMRLRVSGKAVLVTGGGGSIGSELCRQIIRLNPDRLCVLDNSEANLYHVTEELTRLIRHDAGTNVVFHPILGCVTDQNHLSRIFEQNRIDTVFHAAAYKHVPIIEAQPVQGALVNVFGTKSVLRCALANSVSDFLLVSTDKAVRPTNAMGASKRVAELILQEQAVTGTKTRISMVRFGNVIGSSGSVVPKFNRQIREGGPITLTHADVTRYFMTIPEAAQLVLQASAIAKGGDVFVLDMGAPVLIEELARTMVLLSGRKLKKDTGNDEDIDIIELGLRPGEKMYEEMFLTDDHHRTAVAKVFSAHERWVPGVELNARLAELQVSCCAGDEARVRQLLMKLALVETDEPQPEISS
ncbi:MAG: polysaccharide biosynthesis protein [Granulosicoccus sp.]